MSMEAVRFGIRVDVVNRGAFYMNLPPASAPGISVHGAKGLNNTAIERWEGPRIGS